MTEVRRQKKNHGSFLPTGLKSEYPARHGKCAAGIRDTMPTACNPPARSAGRGLVVFATIVTRRSMIVKEVAGNRSARVARPAKIRSSREPEACRGGLELSARPEKSTVPSL
jgi:hypothetical protein